MERSAGRRLALPCTGLYDMDEMIAKLQKKQKKNFNLATQNLFYFEQAPQAFDIFSFEK